MRNQDVNFLFPFPFTQSKDTSDNLSAAEAHSGAAEACVIMGEFEDAIAHYDSYIAYLKAKQSPERNMLAIAVVNRATVLLQLERFREAADELVAAFTIERDPR